MERGAYSKDDEASRTGVGRGAARRGHSAWWRLMTALMVAGLLMVLGSAAAHAAAPTAESKPPGVLRWDRALLGGYVGAGGEPTTYQVEYGKTDSYGSSTPASPVGGPSVGTNFAVSSRIVTGLESGTTYHFRVVASNDSGTATGGDLTFTTPPAPSSRSSRVYEQVSPVDKGGHSVYFGLETQRSYFPAGLSRDGERSVFASWGLHSGAGVGAITSYRSTRTDRGWVTEPISPPMQNPDGFYGDANQLLASTPDLDVDLIETSDVLDPVDVNGSFDFYARAAGESEFELMTRGNNGELTVRGDTTGLGVAIADQGRSVLFSTPDELVPGTAVPGTRQLYLRRRGHTYHVSKLPNGDPAPTEPSWALPFYNNADPLNDLGMLSDDGSRVTFTAGGQIYQWVEGEGTRWVSESETSSAAGSTTLLRSSRDGSKIFFYSGRSLTDDASDDGYYEYSSGESDGDLRYLGGHPTGNDFGSVSSLRVVSRDLSTMFYEVVTIGDDGSYWIDLRRLRDGVATTIARAETDLSGTLELVANRDARSGAPGPMYHVTPDGDAFTFISSAPLTSYDSGGRQMSYVYSEDHGLQCLSCPSDGKPPTLPVLKDALVSLSKTSVITDDGSRVLFSTGEPLVSQDENNRIDVYEWHAGQVSLLSSGRSRSTSRVVGISADGQDAVFSTFESLVSQDVDGGDLDFYDARIGGGFGPEPPRPPAPCAGDTCQGQSPAPPAGGKPGTETFRGAGNVAQAAVRAARVKPVSGVVARLRVRVSGAGRVSVSGSSIRGTSKAAAKAGRVELRVSLKARARRTLRRRGKVVAPVRVSFRAADGETASRSLSVTFERSKGGR